MLDKMSEEEVIYAESSVHESCELTVSQSFEEEETVEFFNSAKFISEIEHTSHMPGTVSTSIDSLAGMNLCLHSSGLEPIDEVPTSPMERSCPVSPEEPRSMKNVNSHPHLLGESGSPSSEDKLNQLRKGSQIRYNFLLS